jgi:hypothetical protein
MTADYISAINVVRRPDQRRPRPGEFLTCRSVDWIKGIKLVDGTSGLGRRPPQQATAQLF